MNEHTDQLASVQDEIYWEPPGAGREAVAAGNIKQGQVFPFEDGQVTITCSWRGQRGRKPAYLWLSWKAEIHSKRDLIIRFLSPESGEVRYEVNLGTSRNGEETFTSRELGFDPSHERFSISVL